MLVALAIIFSGLAFLALGIPLFQRDPERLAWLFEIGLLLLCVALFLVLLVVLDDLFGLISGAQIFRRVA